MADEVPLTYISTMYILNAHRSAKGTAELEERNSLRRPRVISEASPGGGRDAKVRLAGEAAVLPRASDLAAPVVLGGLGWDEKVPRLSSGKLRRPLRQQGAAVSPALSGTHSSGTRTRMSGRESVNVRGCAGSVTDRRDTKSTSTKTSDPRGDGSGPLERITVNLIVRASRALH